jgi:DNA-binding CsgD family transcriptional regulator
MFSAITEPLLAARARAELARIGGRAASPRDLTATEYRVAELVSRGMRNREVAAELFVTVRAVESTLTKIYASSGCALGPSWQRGRAGAEPGQFSVILRVSRAGPSSYAAVVAPPGRVLPSRHRDAGRGDGRGAPRRRARRARRSHGLLRASHLRAAGRELLCPLPRRISARRRCRRRWGRTGVRPDRHRPYHLGDGTQRTLSGTAVVSGQRLAEPDRNRLGEIAAIGLSSVPPAVIGSHRPLNVVNCRRTSFHLQWCRSRSMRRPLATRAK